MASIRKHETKKGIRWEARIHRIDFPPMTRRFGTRAEAEAWGRAQEINIDRGDAPPVRVKAGTTVDQAIDGYLERHEIRATERGSFKIARHDWQGVGIRALSKGSLQTWVTKLAATPVPPQGPKGKGKDTAYAGNTIRLAFFALKKAILWHKDHARYSLPADLFEAKLPQSWSSPRSRRCSSEEQAKLLDHCRDIWHARREDWQRLIRLLLETAMRLQEVVFAEWVHLSEDGRMLFLPSEHVKTGDPRWVPLTGEARNIIAELRKDQNPEDPRIFWHIRRNPNDASHAFATICKNAGIKDLHLHDLRHEATTRLVESKKIDSFRLMLMTGHSNISTFKRYARPEDLADCFD